MREVVQFKGYAGQRHPAVVARKVLPRALMIHTWAEVGHPADLERSAYQSRTDRGDFAYFEEIGPERVVETRHPSGRI